RAFWCVVSDAVLSIIRFFLSLAIGDHAPEPYTSSAPADRGMPCSIERAPHCSSPQSTNRTCFYRGDGRCPDATLRPSSTDSESEKGGHEQSSLSSNRTQDGPLFLQ